MFGDARPLSFLYLRIGREPLLCISKSNENDDNGFRVQSVSRSAWQAWESVTVIPCLTKDRLAIHLLHRQACLNTQNTYTDPATKLKVLTRYAHLQRGKCCGSQCRHCPYGQINVEINLDQPRKIFNTSYYE